MYPKLIHSEIKLTIGMLVSNHVHMIRKCMESVKPLLESVSSELVILDTKGSESDGSIAVCKEYTDRIFPFEWCNDFAAARNALLDHARGEWFLYFDDDEYFDDVQEFIDFFQSGECEAYYSGYYHTRDYSSDGSYSMGVAGRMVRRMENTRFIGKVHETFNEVFAPNKLFHCFTHHYGYAFITEEDKVKHQERNLSILRNEFREHGYTPRICAQMVQELLSRKETGEKGYEFACESITALKKENKLSESCSQWILVATVRYFVQQKDYEAAKKQAKYIKNAYSLSNIANLVLSAVMVRMAGEHGDLEEVLVNIKQYVKEYDWKLANEETALLQTQMDFPRYYEKTYYLNILRVAAVAANYLGEYRLADELWRRFPWEEEGFDGTDYVLDRQETFRGMKLLQQQEEKQDKNEEAAIMKRFKKTEMLEVLETFRKANLVTTMKNITAEQISSVLSKCQKSAVTLGQALKRYGKEGEEAIRLLAEYCEVLYAQNINFGNNKIQMELQEGVKILLNMIEVYIKDNLPEDRKVVVFLPYKASMWDSLESVWRAAKEDPGCDVYVVPIPYFDKLSNNRLGEMHYEGAEYPDYVPVCSWEEFSIADMKPDVIFIHNPYDEYNYTTSIHPAFYTEKLKKYTKKLVYIPYFILTERDPNVPLAAEAEEKLTLFCMQPGVIHSDKVIVQSEAMKKIYVNILTKQFGKDTRKKWEEKVLGLGSPKLDKVQNTKEEDVIIPESWKKVMYSPDGARKKVLLYNTSVIALLKYREKMFEKIQTVLGMAYEYRNDVAFLWRPHPLIEATIRSVCPQLLEIYNVLLDEYRKASWGIYDDTADLSRALALADAYYGDPSSLVGLSKEKGIPTLIQKIDMEEEMLFTDYLNFVIKAQSTESKAEGNFDNVGKTIYRTLVITD